jgi:archaemetzincin
MSLQPVTLISFGYFEKDFLKQTAEAVKHEFHSPVHIREGHIDLSDFYDPARRQYNANQILRQVETELAVDSAKILGLFNVDLFIPILTYIFGQAYLGGRSGIASMYRLDNERYGMEADEQKLLERFIKEVIHELGHTFGLIHCLNPACVMRPSTYVEDIDQKKAHLCFNCRKQLEIADE